MAPKIITIAGFTGRIARLTTTALLQNHPDVQIHGIARSPDKVTQYKDKNNIKIFPATSDDVDGIRKALRGASVCICCYLGNDSLMLDGQKLLIDACIAEGVPRYIASDWALDFRALNFGDHPTKDAMKHVQAYLDEKENRGLIRAVHILTGGFMEVVFAPFSGYFDAKTHTFYQWGTGDEKIDLSTMPDVGRWTAEVAVDQGANGFLNFLGDRKSVKELAQLFEQTYNVTPKIEVKGTLENLQAAKKAAFKADPMNPYAWMGLHYQAVMLNGQTVLGKLDNERYPNVKPLDVEAFLKTQTLETLPNSMALL